MSALVLTLALFLILLLLDPAVAQTARHPFAVGGSEGAPAATGAFGLVIAWQNRFHQELQAAARLLKTDGSAFWTLLAASFAYGVFHAAGPGHGKAVLASYMVANETALRRGMLLAALAAMLQGAVAIAIVGVAAVIFHATAQRMTDAANVVEVASYGAIAALGARLVWVKGWGFVAALRSAPAAAQGRFVCVAADDPGHSHGPGCGHFQAPDPATLGPGFSWPDALATVVAAGLRPCSGAILVLVFTLAQNMFAAGAAAVGVMSAGAAITTGALASLAVFAKGAAKKLGGAESRRGLLLGRGVELAAAVLVLALGLVLLFGVGASRGLA